MAHHKRNWGYGTDDDTPERQKANRVNDRWQHQWQHEDHAEDKDHSEDEERFVLLGLSSSLRVILVCHCYRDEGGVIRIISARKATSHESK